MARLPNPGGDDGTWGDILNAYLEVSLNSDGTLKTSAISSAGGELTSNKGAAGGYAGLNGSSHVPSGQLGSGTANTTTYLRGDGTWEVPPGSGGSSTLAGDTDVSIVSPTNNQVLTYNSGSSLWVNQAPPVTSVAGHTGAVTLAESDITNLTTDLAAKAADSAVVHNTGNENISGTKTFTSAPTVPSGSFPESAVTNLTTDLSAKVSKAGDTMTGKLVVPSFQVTGGSPASGEVLTADGSGNATWQSFSSSAAVVDYLIYETGGTVHAKNSSTGAVDFSDTHLNVVLQSVIDALIPYSSVTYSNGVYTAARGGYVAIASGDYTMNGPVYLPGGINKLLTINAKGARITLGSAAQPQVFDTRRPRTTLSSSGFSMASTPSTITLADASNFPSSGVVAIGGTTYPLVNGVYLQPTEANHLVAYTGKSGNNLTGCTQYEPTDPGGAGSGAVVQLATDTLQNINLEDFYIDANNLHLPAIPIASGGTINWTPSNVTVNGDASAWPNAGILRIYKVAAGTNIVSSYNGLVNNGDGTWTFQNVKGSSSQNNTYTSSDYLGGPSAGHVFWGCQPSGVRASYLNLSSLIARRCTIVNLWTSNTPQDHALIGICFTPDIRANSETVATLTASNLLFDEIWIGGGSGGVWITLHSAAGSGVVGLNDPPLFDEIHIRNCHYDAGSVPTATYNAGGFFIGGGVAKVIRASVVGCYGRGARDIGVEIDSADDAFVKDCVMVDCNNPYLAATFNKINDFNASRYLYDNCVVRQEQNGVNGSGFNMNCSNGWQLNTVIYKNCKYIRRATALNTLNKWAFGGNSGSSTNPNHVLNHLVLDNCRVVIEGQTWDASQAATAQNHITYGPNWQSNTGSISSGTNTLTCTSGMDTSFLVGGQVIVVAGAGANGSQLRSTIASVSSNVITLADNAATTVTNANVGIQLTSTPCNIVIKNLMLHSDGNRDTTNGTNKLTVKALNLNGYMALTIDGLNVSMPWTNLSAGGFQAASMLALDTGTNPAVQIASGSIRRLVVRQWSTDNGVSGSTTGSAAIRFGLTKNLTILPPGFLVIEECDFSVLQNGEALFFQNASTNNGNLQKGHVILRDNIWPTPLAPTTLSPSASPWIYQNIDGYRERVLLSGGIITKIENGSGVYTEGDIASGSNQLTVRTNTGMSASQTIVVTGAGASSADLVSTISSISGNVLTLADNAGTTINDTPVTVSTLYDTGFPAGGTFTLENTEQLRVTYSSTAPTATKVPRG